MHLFILLFFELAAIVKKSDQSTSNSFMALLLKN